MTNGSDSAGRVRPLYWLIRFTAFVFFKVFYRITIKNIENVPLSGGAIIAPNHASMLDPPAVGSIIPREVSFFAKKELFRIPMLREFLQYVKTIPVDRKGYSAGALKDIVRCLKNGRAVIIFPEGTRTKTGDFLQPKKGAAMTAVMAGVPIVPCWVQGSYHAKPLFSKITIHFLPPFSPDEIEAETKKEHYLLVSDRIMCDISRLSKKHAAVLN